ncbi:MAG: type II toxin-antitoxin system death-on-curing family toxin [Flavobacteriales bacterium]|nr:type II toxin-antitoxin system death-on-curing family toxin [Flavobacteriales bacterium]
MPRLRRILPEEWEGLFERAREEHVEAEEPLPELKSDSRARIEACLAAPFQTFDGKDLHQGLRAKCAALFYGIAKGHPLANGNKRMAILTLAYFLHINGYVLHMSDDELEDLAFAVANSTDHQQALTDIDFRLRITRRM